MQCVVSANDPPSNQTDLRCTPSQSAQSELTKVLTAHSKHSFRELNGIICRVIQQVSGVRCWPWVWIHIIHAEVKLMKCIADGMVVDISANQFGGLATLGFLEVGQR